jgi:hypothetical protein
LKTLSFEAEERRLRESQRVNSYRAFRDTRFHLVARRHFIDCISVISYFSDTHPSLEYSPASQRTKTESRVRCSQINTRKSPHTSPVSRAPQINFKVIPSQPWPCSAWSTRVPPSRRGEELHRKICNMRNCHAIVPIRAQSYPTLAILWRSALNIVEAVKPKQIELLSSHFNELLRGYSLPS